MTPSTAELARALVASPRWEWRAGMRVIGRRRLAAAWFRAEETMRQLSGEWATAIPDLDDPATAGVLLGMLAGPWVVGLLEGRYAVTRGDYGMAVMVAEGPTLGVAVARALLAVWEQP